MGLNKVVLRNAKIRLRKVVLYPHKLTQGKVFARDVQPDLLDLFQDGLIKPIPTLSLYTLLKFKTYRGKKGQRQAKQWFITHEASFHPR